MTQEELIQAIQERNILTWRVLILDEFASDLIACLFHIADLRLHNITLDLPLHGNRDPLPLLTAVYLCLPTQENIQRIVKDSNAKLYDNFQINFLRPVSEDLLRELAEGISQDISRLDRCFDQYCSYISLEPNLFTLGNYSYKMLHEPGRNDEEIHDMFDSISVSLYSLFKSLNAWPIIRAVQGVAGASEFVAQRIAELCGDDPEQGNQMSRPLLLLVDRGIDLATMLQHPWTYQALAHDLIPAAHNKLFLNNEFHEMDKRRDTFWRDQSAESFETVLQEIEKLVSAWKTEYETTNFVDSIESVPELTEKKNRADLHTNLATKLLDSVKERSIDKLHTFEEDMLHTKTTPADLKEVLAAPGNDQDKLRLLCIAYLSKCLKLQDIADFDLDLDLSPIQYLEHMSSLIGENQEQEVSSLKFLANKVKDMIGGDKVCEVTRILHSVMQNKAKNLLYLDSKFQTSTAYKREFSNIVVFVIGGGCYSEYHDLQNYGKRTKKNVIYGCTQMCSPQNFLEQLRSLA